MMTLNLLIAAVVIYFVGVYIAHFAYGVLGEPDDIDEEDVWFCPLLLILLCILIAGEKIVSVAQRWNTRLTPITGHIARFLRKSLFFLSLPFRPLDLGRFVRNAFTSPK